MVKNPRGVKKRSQNGITKQHSKQLSILKKGGKQSSPKKNEASKKNRPVAKLIPPVITLADSEKFKDGSGKNLEIKVVGDRKKGTVYFKTMDVQREFGISGLSNNVTGLKRDTYKPNIEYMIFTEKNNKRKTCYLTYRGLMRAIFCKRIATKSGPCEWAANTLYTCHLGSMSQKETFAGKLLGIPVEDIKSFLSATRDRVSCIYLFALGTVKDNRETFDISEDISDDSIVYKFGMTIDLSLRTGQHNLSYGKKLECAVSLKLFRLIDPDHVVSAEKELKKFFKGTKFYIKNKKYMELAAFSNKDFTTITTAYEKISTKYTMHVKTIIDNYKDNDTKLQIECARKEKVIAEKNSNILQKNIAISELEAKKNDAISEIVAEKNAIISTKDLEIAALKQELLNKQHEHELTMAKREVEFGNEKSKYLVDLAKLQTEITILKKGKKLNK